MRTPALVIALVLLAAGAASAVGDRSARTVHFRGTAYEFNNSDTRLAGATIRVAEFPNLRATVRRDGSYDLVVPAHARITPYIVDAGYHTIYLQTFTTGGEDLANVNFQTPTQGIYQALAALLSVPLDSDGNPSDCAIVSTFSTKNVRDLNFAGFTAYGAHGVAGATARGKPALPEPVYFNASVIPDSSQKVSSVDGGVVWTRVPPGTFTITASHPSTRFASLVATCRKGRVVNASPPWGLHELAPANPARIAARWSGGKLRSLRATRLPPVAIVSVSCAGARCPFSVRTIRPTVRSLDLAPALGSAAARLRPGQTLEVAVSAHAFNGVVVRWRIARSAAPKPTALCVPLGETQVRSRC